MSYVYRTGKKKGVDSQQKTRLFFGWPEEEQTDSKKEREYACMDASWGIKGLEEKKTNQTKKKKRI